MFQLAAVSRLSVGLGATALNSRRTFGFVPPARIWSRNATRLTFAWFRAGFGDAASADCTWLARASSDRGVTFGVGGPHSGSVIGPSSGIPGALIVTRMAPLAGSVARLS